jgi:hypothetical protein
MSIRREWEKRAFKLILEAGDEELLQMSGARMSAKRQVSSISRSPTRSIANYGLWTILNQIL